nr:hypothetical protein [Phycisphaerae bacterium]NIX27998.1 hypothetical protein [Phycisphaerae bacterium]
IRYLRQAATREELLIIGISASAFVHDRKRSLDAGADVFLAKPFRHEVLLELLTERLNLEPVFENDGGVGERQAQTRIAVVFPGGEVLAELSEFARQGDIKTLVDQANSLAQQNEQFVEFSNYLKKLAKEFKIKKITQFLQAGYGSH